MHYPRVLFIVLALIAAASAQATPDADALFREMKEQAESRRPPENLTQEEGHDWLVARADRASRLAEQFADNYPSDPRKWDALGLLATLPRRTTTPEEAAAFAHRRQDARDRILESSGAPEEIVSRAYVAELERLIDSPDGGKPDLARSEALLARYRAQFPQSSSRIYAENLFLRALKGADRADAEAYVEKLVSDPNEKLAEYFRNQEVRDAAVAAFRSRPISLKRTAFDGREVDFTKLRGKVVLIDFWATWCVPCMEQMPEIKRVYRKYRDQGFEVVGVADEIRPKDPDHPRGVEKTPAQLQAFLDKHEMPWPQLWDQRSVAERGGLNEYSKLFGVEVLPTTFLLDRDGRIATTDNHGEKLEENVRRLLGLPALSSSADSDFAAFCAMRDAKPPAPLEKMGRVSYLTWWDHHHQELLAAGLAFYEQHPEDPRRWEVAVALFNAMPFFVKQYGPDAEELGLNDAVIDKAARESWINRMSELQEALSASPDAKPEQRELAEWLIFVRDFHAAMKAIDDGAPSDFGPLLRRFTAHLKKYESMDGISARARDFLAAVESKQPGTTEEIWRGYLQSPNASLRESAEAKLAEFRRTAELKSKPLELAFTAVDGRQVDLADLRGKVVLIDFWATWCHPCIAELPNVKDIYSQYHDKGFEIIGITLEDARLTPSDTPDQTAAKLAKAKQVLTSFIAKENLPWPQYFDGKDFKNDISSRFGIRSIPAMYLLDQSGKVVSTNARGAKLEAEVKRLLNL